MLIKTAHVNVWSSRYTLYKCMVVLNLVLYTVRNTNGRGTTITKPYHSGDNATNFEKDKHFLLLVLLISLSSSFSFGLAFHGFLCFYLNTALIHKPWL